MRNVFDTLGLRDIKRTQQQNKKNNEITITKHRQVQKKSAIFALIKIEIITNKNHRTNKNKTHKKIKHKKKKRIRE